MFSKPTSETLYTFPFKSKKLKLLNKGSLLVFGGSGESALNGYNRLQSIELNNDKVPEIKVSGEISFGNKEIQSFDLMPISRINSVLCAFKDSCVEYYCSPLPKSKEINDETVVKRKGSIQFEDSSRSLQFTHMKDVSFDNDSLKPLTIRACPISGNYVVGFSNGTVHLYKQIDFNLSQSNCVNPALVIKAHTGPITCVDIGSNSTRILTISSVNGYEARLWSGTDGRQLLECTNRPCVRTGHLKATTSELEIRFAVLGKREGSEDAECVLYTLHCPMETTTVASDGLGPSTYLTSWNCRRYVHKLVTDIGSELPMCFSISPEGRYLAVGGISGNVQMFISFSLQSLYKINLSCQISDTLFLPIDRAEANEHDVELLTLDADNQLVLHWVSQRASIAIFWPIVGTIAMIVLIFYTISELGL